MRGKFNEEELISFLEQKILFNEADNDEMEMYEDWVWNGFINKIKYNDTYTLVVREMNNEYEGRE